MADTAVTAAPLRISLAGIAALARVKRPVVSVWRSRFCAGDTPFPEPVGAENGQEIFDAGQVARWLVQTHHGNNPDAIADAGAHAALGGMAPAGSPGFDALTALIALRAAHAAPLAALDPRELVDLADAIDPDDDCLLREIERLDGDGDGDSDVDGNLEAYAGFVDVLVDGAYSAAAAFENVMAGRFRDGRRDLARVSLSDTAVSLVADAALALAVDNQNRFGASGSAPLRFVDPTGASADLLVGLVARAAEYQEIILATANDAAQASRLLRRRLMAHSVLRQGLDVRQSGEFAASGPLVHLAQYPNPARPGEAPAEILAAIENIALQMDDRQRAVIVAPATVLCDGRLPAAAAELRARVLRSGRIRAIVRLPAGLVTASPRRALALWVLGPGHAAVALGERWTVVADLSERTLTEASAADLVSDLTAAMGEKAEVRAHAFRFARFVLTSSLLARSGSLVTRRMPVQHAPSSPLTADASRGSSAAEAALRADRLLRSLEGAPAGGPALGALRVEQSRAASSLPVSTLGDLAAEGHLRLRPGTRLRADHLEATEGFAVIGPADLYGGAAAGRRIDRLDFAEHYPAARLTEPGDVVFCTAPTPAARVDRHGSSVVAYPARVLRINAADPAGLLPDLLASAITRAPSGARDWRRWRVRRVLPQQRAPLEQALEALRHRRDSLHRRLAELNELDDLITEAVTAGILTLTAPER